MLCVLQDTKQATVMSSTRSAFPQAHSKQSHLLRDAQLPCGRSSLSPSPSQTQAAAAAHGRGASQQPGSRRGSDIWSMASAEISAVLGTEKQLSRGLTDQDVGSTLHQSVEDLEASLVASAGPPPISIKPIFTHKPSNKRPTKAAHSATLEEAAASTIEPAAAARMTAAAAAGAAGQYQAGAGAKDGKDGSTAVIAQQGRPADASTRSSGPTGMGLAALLSKKPASSSAAPSSANGGARHARDMPAAQDAAPAVGWRASAHSQLNAAWETDEVMDQEASMDDWLKQSPPPLEVRPIFLGSKGSKRPRVAVATQAGGSVQHIAQLPHKSKVSQQAPVQGVGHHHQHGTQAALQKQQEVEEQPSSPASGFFVRTVRPASSNPEGVTRPASQEQDGQQVQGQQLGDQEGGAGQATRHSYGNSRKRAADAADRGGLVQGSKQVSAGMQLALEEHAQLRTRIQLQALQRARALLSNYMSAQRVAEQHLQRRLRRLGLSDAQAAAAATSGPSKRVCCRAPATKAATLDQQPAAASPAPSFIPLVTEQPDDDVQMVSEPAPVQGGRSTQQASASAAQQARDGHVRVPAAAIEHAAAAFSGAVEQPIGGSHASGSGGTLPSRLSLGSSNTKGAACKLRLGSVRDGDYVSQLLQRVQSGVETAVASHVHAQIRGAGAGAMNAQPAVSAGVDVASENRRGIGVAQDRTTVTGQGECRDSKRPRMRKGPQLPASVQGAAAASQTEEKQQLPAIFEGLLAELDASLGRKSCAAAISRKGMRPPGKAQRGSGLEKAQLGKSVPQLLHRTRKEGVRPLKRPGSAHGKRLTRAAAKQSAARDKLAPSAAAGPDTITKQAAAQGQDTVTTQVAAQGQDTVTKQGTGQAQAGTKLSSPSKQGTAAPGNAAASPGLQSGAGTAPASQPAATIGRSSPASSPANMSVGAMDANRATAATIGKGTSPTGNAVATPQLRQQQQQQMQGFKSAPQAGLGHVPQGVYLNLSSQPPGSVLIGLGLKSAATSPTSHGARPSTQSPPQVVSRMITKGSTQYEQVVIDMDDDDEGDQGDEAALQRSSMAGPGAGQPAGRSSDVHQQQQQNAVATAQAPVAKAAGDCVQAAAEQHRDRAAAAAAAPTDMQPEAAQAGAKNVKPTKHQDAQKQQQPTSSAGPAQNVRPKTSETTTSHATVVLDEDEEAELAAFCAASKVAPSMKPVGRPSKQAGRSSKPRHTAAAAAKHANSKEPPQGTAKHTVRSNSPQVVDLSASTPSPTPDAVPVHQHAAKHAPSAAQQQVRAQQQATDVQQQLQQQAAVHAAAARYVAQAVKAQHAAQTLPQQQQQQQQPVPGSQSSMQQPQQQQHTKMHRQQQQPQQAQPKAQTQQAQPAQAQKQTQQQQHQSQPHPQQAQQPQPQQQYKQQQQQQQSQQQHSQQQQATSIPKGTSQVDTTAATAAARHASKPDALKLPDPLTFALSDAPALDNNISVKLLKIFLAQAGAGNEAATCYEKGELLALAQTKQAAWEIRRIAACDAHIKPVLRAQAAVFKSALGNQAAIDKLYKDLRVKVHPDKNNGDALATKAFQVLSTAHKAISQHPLKGKGLLDAFLAPMHQPGMTSTAQPTMYTQHQHQPQQQMPQQTGQATYVYMGNMQAPGQPMQYSRVYMPGHFSFYTTMADHGATSVHVAPASMPNTGGLFSGHQPPTGTWGMPPL